MRLIALTAQRFSSLPVVQRLVTVSAIASLALSTAACGGDSGEPDGVGNPVGPGPNNPSNPTTPTEPDPAPAPTSTLGDMPNAFCSQTPPPNTNITTFRPGSYTVGSTIGNDSWDDTGDSLSGGAFEYDDDPDSVVVTRILTDDGLNIVANVASGGYAGFGLWFGPCTYAAHYRGISFSIIGQLDDTDPGEGELVVQLQQATNYPLESDKGACDYAAAGIMEADKWNYCKNHQLATEGTNPDEATVFELTWDMFSGGEPNTEVDPAELLGVQLQLNCGDGDGCAFDFTLADLKFLE